MHFTGVFCDLQNTPVHLLVYQTAWKKQHHIRKQTNSRHKTLYNHCLVASQVAIYGQKTSGLAFVSRPVEEKKVLYSDETRTELYVVYLHSAVSALRRGSLSLKWLNSCKENATKNRKRRTTTTV